MGLVLLTPASPIRHSPLLNDCEPLLEKVAGDPLGVVGAALVKFVHEAIVGAFVTSHEPEGAVETIKLALALIPVSLPLMYRSSVAFT